MRIVLERFFVYLVAALGLGLGVAGLLAGTTQQFVVGTVLMVVAVWLSGKGMGIKNYE